MADLTAGRKVTSVKPNPYDMGMEIIYTVAASTTIYEGAFVIIDAGGDIVRATGAAVGIILGVALETVDNVNGSDADLSCRVLVGGTIEHTVANETKADIGKIVHTSDDQTLTLTATTNEFAGWIIGMADNSVNAALFLIKMPWPGQTDAGHVS